jgi:hypothetical protein
MSDVRPRPPGAPEGADCSPEAACFAPLAVALLDDAVALSDDADLPMPLPAAGSLPPQVGQNRASAVISVAQTGHFIAVDPTKNGPLLLVEHAPPL